MVQTCVVVGCKNRWQKCSSLSWHRFPSEGNLKRRKVWLAAINRKNWTPKCHDRICGKHFVSGSASQNPEDQDYAPSLYLGYNAHTICHMTDSMLISQQMKGVCAERDELREFEPWDDFNTKRLLVTQPSIISKMAAQKLVKESETSESMERLSQCVLCKNAGSHTEMKSLHKALVMQGHPDGLTLVHVLGSQILAFSPVEEKYCLSCLQACERVSKIKRNIEDLMRKDTLTGHALSKSCKRKAASQITFPGSNMKRSRMGAENAKSQVQLSESEPTRFCLADGKIEPEYEIRTQDSFERNSDSLKTDEIKFEVQINPDYLVKEEPKDKRQMQKEIAESQAELHKGFSTETCTADVKKEPGLEIQTHMNEDINSRRLSAVEVKDQSECQSQVTGVNVPLTESIPRSSSDEGKRQLVNQTQSQISGVNLINKVQLLQFTPTCSFEAQRKTVLENKMQNKMFGVNFVNKVPYNTLNPANTFTSEENIVSGNQISGVNSVKSMPSAKLIGISGVIQSGHGNQVSGVIQSGHGNQVSGGIQSGHGNQVSGVNLNRMPLVLIIPTSSCIVGNKTLDANMSAYPYSFNIA